MHREYKGYLIKEFQKPIVADQGTVIKKQWNVLKKGADTMEWKEMVASGFKSEADAEEFIEELM